MVKIYESKEAFDKREDKSVNGVTQDYLYGFGLTLEEVASSLIGCEGCFNCHDCYNCKWCERCIECYMCIECYGCRECFRCNECKACLNCRLCIECEDCVECFKCEECVKCRGCFKCEDYKRHIELCDKLNKKDKSMTTPLNTKDLIRLSNEQKKKIGEGKDTFQEGVLFGYQLQSQICCEWDVEILHHSDMTSEYIYTKGCNGGVVTSSTDLSKYNEDIYCDGCRHRVRVVK